jgi:hypothetical protein
MSSYDSALRERAGDPAWGPVPARPAVLRWLVLLPLTVLFLPLWWVVWLLAVVVLYFVAPFVELFVYLLPRTENGAVRMLDATVGRLPFVPLWCVGPVELLHEGDAEFYRARVERRVERATRRAESSQGIVRSERELDLGARFFRGVGAGYVLRLAADRNWDFHPVLRSRPRRRVRLRHNGRPGTR